MLSWMKFVSRVGRAYSSRYTPAAIPTGKASTITIAAIMSEPQMPWLTPALASVSTSRRRPSALSLRPPGICRACVTSNSKG